jgi:hypothetical protein
MSDKDQSVGAVRDQALSEVGGETPFHSYTGDDGNVQSWKTPDELNGFIKKSGMFQADYTRKSQTREAEYRKRMEELDKKESEWKKQREDWEKNEKAKYDRYNEALSKRPNIARQLAKLVDQPTSPDEIFDRSRSYADDRYSTLEQEINNLKQQREEERLEKERDKYFAELEEELPGFDRNEVMQALQTMDAGDMKSLMSTIWKANKYNPVEMQEKVEQTIVKNKGAKMAPGGGQPTPKHTGSTDPKIAREEALRDYAAS